MNRLLVIALIGIVIIVGAIAIAIDNTQQENGFETGVGGGPGEVDNQQNQEESQDPTLAQRANMHRILQEHAITASLHLQAFYDEEDVSDTTENLEENTDEFMLLVNDLSNNSSTEELERIWAEHMELYEQYTTAVREENTEQARLIQNELQTLSLEFGREVNNLLPNVPVEQAANAMREHVNLTLAIVDAHAEDDTSEKITLSTRASAQAAEFAEAIVPDE